MGVDIFDKIVKVFEQWPGVLALLCVIYWLIKIIYHQDELIKDLMQLSKGDVEQRSKMLTLLDLIVSRK
jgi:hypothetical protein